MSTNMCGSATRHFAGALERLPKLPDPVVVRSNPKARHHRYVTKSGDQPEMRSALLRSACYNASPWLHASAA